jgi:hypothetical protein
LILKDRYGKTVYAKLAKREGKVEKQPWDSNTDKAKTLNIDDFGTLDEVEKASLLSRSH